MPRERPLRRMWSPGKPGNPRVRRTHIMWLRHKLGEDASGPRYILNEPRVGYRLGPAEPGEPAP